MSKEGLLFIPDISGFSRFVEKTEIEHCQYIIKKLLEVLINSNQLQLQVSEIEGDAILFYKFGNPPGIKEIYQQIEKMFCDFHHMLRSMSVRRLCQCGACKEAEHLSLKIITHQGEFTTYNIKDFTKLIGKDVIRAHQLLKNDIEDHEYWLATDNLFTQPVQKEELPDWMIWLPGTKEVENDSIRFQYAFLSPLKDKVPEESVFPSAVQEGKKEILSVTREMQADFLQLFYLVANLEMREHWVDGVTGVDRMGHPDNIVGAAHRCILENRNEVFVTSFIRATDTCIEYEETTHDRQRTMHYEFRQINPHISVVTETVYMKKNALKEMLFRWFMKKKITAMLNSSLDKLNTLYQQQTGDTHPHHHHEEHEHHEHV